MREYKCWLDTREIEREADLHHELVAAMRHWVPDPLDPNERHKQFMAYATRSTSPEKAH